ncbi:hypothetical protein ACKQTC_02355 [Peptococcus simiae]|uniref:Uncharacterized protein n=1 Tax=Peptococcus simiae TaxID=1643805 RepID=A0ABW9GX56_9FIRM
MLTKLNMPMIQSLEKEFIVTGKSIFAEFPEEFTCFEVMSALQMPKLLFPEAKNPDRALRFSINSAMVFLAVKLHILTMGLTHSETDTKLEMAVLNGDLLSARFAQRMISENEFDLLKGWLESLLPFYNDLTNMSLENVPQDTRMLSYPETLLAYEIAIAADHADDFGETPLVVQDHLPDLVQGLVCANWTPFLSAVSQVPALTQATQDLIRLQEAYQKVPLVQFSIPALEAEQTI